MSLHVTETLFGSIRVSDYRTMTTYSVKRKNNWPNLFDVHEEKSSNYWWNVDAVDYRDAVNKVITKGRQACAAVSVWYDSRAVLVERLCRPGCAPIFRVMGYDTIYNMREVPNKPGYYTDDSSVIAASYPEEAVAKLWVKKNRR